MPYNLGRGAGHPPWFTASGPDKFNRPRRALTLGQGMHSEPVSCQCRALSFLACDIPSGASNHISPATKTPLPPP